MCHHLPHMFPTNSSKIWVAMTLSNPPKTAPNRHGDVLCGDRSFSTTPWSQSPRPSHQPRKPWGSPPDLLATSAPHGTCTTHHASHHAPTYTVQYTYIHFQFQGPQSPCKPDRPIYEPSNWITATSFLHLAKRLMASAGQNGRISQKPIYGSLTL
jgi:hypothetical protein